MKENLLIITKVKKTIEYLDKIIENFPKKEIVLRNELSSKCYKLLETSYYAKHSKEKYKYQYQIDMIVIIKMIDYYLKRSMDKNIISYKKYNQIGTHLLELVKMVMSWIKNEKSEESI